tara:strand:+ start:67 stop:435 length:369 start_codon:yes stop_codon:yes gene_type:complete
MAIAAILLDVGDTLITTTILTSVLAVGAYCGIFLLLGLMVKNPVMWGLAYIFIWEATIASFAKPAAALSVSGYSRSIMAGRTGVDFDYLWSPSQGTSIFMLGIIVIVSIGVSSIRLNRLEVP